MRLGLMPTYSLKKGASSQLIARAARKRRRQFVEAGAPRLFCRILRTTNLQEVALHLLVALEVLTRDTAVQVCIGRPLIPLLLFFIQEEKSVKAAATAVRVLQNLMTNQVRCTPSHSSLWQCIHFCSSEKSSCTPQSRVKV